MTQSLHSSLESGTQLFRANRLDEAWQLAQSLMGQYPDQQDAFLFAADAADLQNDLPGAISCLDSFLAGGQGTARVLLRKAQLLFRDRQRGAALESARGAAEIIDSDIWNLRTLAQILRDCQDQAAALGWLLRAHEIFPKSPQILYDLAIAEFHLNLPEDAEKHAEAVLELEPYHTGALHLRSAVRKQTPEQNHIAHLQDRLSSGPQHPKLLASANYALAKEYEDLNQYDDSFAALEKGASAYRSTVNFDLEGELSAHEHMKKQFTREAFLSVEQGLETEGPIFVIGMPRTGTTLVERLLSSHSEVCSIGEFLDFPQYLAELIQQGLPEGTSEKPKPAPALSIDFDTLGKHYAASARQLAGDSKYFVDKLPYNFQYCGYILNALPNAKLVHLTRDPLDTCYAVYKTLFFGAYNFSYDLDELADYYIDYRQLMDHWHEVLPDKILDVAYEQLVRDPEQQSRRIVEWCALPWEDSLLDFHQLDTPSMTASAMQVRSPMHADSIGAWRRAGKGFDGLRQRLTEAGLVPKAQ